MVMVWPRQQGMVRIGQPQAWLLVFSKCLSVCHQPGAAAHLQSAGPALVGGGVQSCLSEVWWKCRAGCVGAQPP